MKAFITGSGMCVPERIVSNEELADSLGVTPERIYKSSGIRRRRWANPGTRTSELGAQALNHALHDAQLSRHDVDYLILGTQTPDRVIPGTGVAVQAALSLPPIPTLDIRNTCCNALYGLQVARSLIASGTARNIALCLADVQSPWLDLSAESGSMSMLFGDGAAAIIVSAAEHHSASTPALQIIDVLLHTDGTHIDELGIRAPGTEFGPDTGKVHCADLLPRMNGQKVLMRAARSMASASRKLLEHHNLAPHDVHWVVPHQANENVMRQLLRLLGILRHADRLVSVMEEYGNTSSASMGMALDALRHSGKLHRNQYVLMPAFGAGFTWGAALCKT